LVFKEYHLMLEAVYNSYKEVSCYPGRVGMGLTFGGWEQLLLDSKLDECGVSIREAGVAFALGKELRTDEYSNMRHMELSWSEFLSCLGALMMLRADFDSEFFADMLADFFSDHLSNARQSHLDGQGKPGNDEGLSQVLIVVTKVFYDADEDKSGTLTMTELKRCMAQQQVRQELKEIGVPVEDIGTFFCHLDKDHSGDVTLDELCEGFIKLKLSMRGVDRSIAYFRKAFAEADVDDSGTLSIHEFKALCSNPRVLKRLGALGVQVGEVETLFETLCIKGLDKSGMSTSASGFRPASPSADARFITADDLIAGFLAVRKVGLGEQRGVNMLRQIFLEADVNGDNSLDREEMRAAFCTERVSQKLQRLQLTEPDWMAIFDALDTDGNGDISWAELSQGVCTLWHQAIEEYAEEQAHKYSALVEGSQSQGLMKATQSFPLSGAKEGGLSADTKRSTLPKSKAIAVGAFAHAEAGVSTWPLSHVPSKALAPSASGSTLQPATSARSLTRASVSPGMSASGSLPGVSRQMSPDRTTSP
jgi:Ca2+-binding EF-hand superfamily protein